MIGKTCPSFFAPVALLFFVQCMSGPSTEQGNPQIAAVVVDSMKRPVPAATVTVYQVPINADSTIEPSGAILVGLSYTNSNGSCTFQNLTPGTYSLKAVGSDSTKSTIKTNILISLSKPQEPEYSDTLIINSPGGFHGIVARSVPITNNQKLQNGFIQIKIGELDRSTVTGPDGKYSFSNLPAGTYSVYYYTEGFFSAKKENIFVRPGKDSAIDSVILKPRTLPPPRGFEAVYDTTNGIVHFHWQKVNFDGLWHYTLERACISDPDLDKTFAPFDTVYHDTLGSIPVGDTLYYVVRSIDKALNASVNTGPIVITVMNKR